MVTLTVVDIGSGNGLLPDGTKPLPEHVLINLKWSVVAFTWGQFHKISIDDMSLKITRSLLQGPMS